MPIVINAKDFWQGVSTSDFLSDRGYSPEDKGQNLYVKKGLLYPQPLATSKGALTPNGCVAHAFNEDLTAELKGLGADNSDGYFYSFAADGTPTLESTDTGRDYSGYSSDMIFYSGSFFVTSKTNIAKLDSSFQTPDYDWWTAVAGGSALHAWLPHQIIEFEDVMYIADEENLKSWDGSNFSNSALDLKSNFKITALVVYQNKIFITAERLFNAGGGQTVTSKMFVWNGTDPSYSKEYYLPEKIFTMIEFNGALILFGVYSVYYWNGVGFTRLFDLPNTSNPVYKQRVLRYKDRLYFANGDYIICYDGQRFSYLLDTNNASGNLTGEKIESIISTKDDDFRLTADNYTYNLELETGTGVGYWRSNRFNFGRNTRITKVFIELGEPLVASSEIVFSLIDERGDEVNIGSMLYSAGDRYVKEFFNINKQVLSFQLRVHWKTNGKPIRQITIEHEPIGKRIEQS